MVADRRSIMGQSTRSEFRSAPRGSLEPSKQLSGPLSNEDLETARLNLAVFVAKQPYELDDLREEARPTLVACAHRAGRRYVMHTRRQAWSPSDCLSPTRWIRMARWFRNRAVSPSAFGPRMLAYAVFVPARHRMQAGPGASLRGSRAALIQLHDGYGH